MISAVFDAQVFLQAVANSKGPAGACLALVDSGDVKLYTSRATLDVIRGVLSRPKIRRAFRKLTDEIAEAFLDHLFDKGHLIEPVPELITLDRDPKDSPYLNLAVAARASFLVSRDKDLLDLMHSAAFCSTHATLSIIDPAEFLSRVDEIRKSDAGSA